MVFIITKNDNVLTTCDTLDNVYHNILIYTRIILYCDKNKIDFFNNLKITEYLNGYPIESYEISDSLDICNSKNELISIQNNILNKNKLELELLIKKDNIESDINIFIPLDSQNVKPINNFILSHLNRSQQSKKVVHKPIIREKEEKHSENQKSVSLDEINKIKELKEKIEMEKNRLNNINDDYDKKLNKYLDTKHKYGLLECELKNNKEKADQDRRIFISDKNIYNKICKEIENNTRDLTDIPPIFKVKFDIFKELNSKFENINLSNSEGYDEYLDIYSKKKNAETKKSEDFITKYDNMFDENPYYGKLSNDLNNISDDSGSDNISDDSVSDIDNINSDNIHNYYYR